MTCQRATTTPHAILLLLAVGLLPLAGCGSPPGAGAAEVHADVEALTHRFERHEALRRLLISNRYGEFATEPQSDCRVLHVVLCPQRGGPAMTMVFKAEDWGENHEGPGKALGHVILFEPHGTLVPWFENANTVEPGGVVRDLDRDGRIDVMDRISCEGIDVTYEKLYVLPVTRHMEPSLRVLWLDEAWGYAAIDPDGDGESEIVIGPDPTGLPPRVAARYRWDRKAGAWKGPDGSLAGDFVTIRPGDDVDAIEEAFGKRR